MSNMQGEKSEVTRQTRLGVLVLQVTREFSIN